MWNPNSFIKWQQWCKEQNWLEVLREIAIATSRHMDSEAWQTAFENWMVAGQLLEKALLNLRAADEKTDDGQLPPTS